MPQLLAVALSQRLGDLVQQVDARLRDASQNLAAVLIIPNSLDQPTFNKSIEQSRDIRRSRNQSLAYRKRRHGSRMRCLQQSQHVVLLAIELELAKQLILQFTQAIKTFAKDSGTTPAESNRIAISLMADCQKALLIVWLFVTELATCYRRRGSATGQTVEHPILTGSFSTGKR